MGVILALVGFGLAVVLGGALGGARSVAGGPANNLVVYAARDIGLRNQITTQDQLVVTGVPDAYKPAGAITIPAGTRDSDRPSAALKAVQGDIAEVNIAAGQPLLTSMLAKPGDTVTGAQAAYLPIPQGYVAFTLPTSELVGVAGYIQPNDYIGLVASTGSGKTGAVVTVFSQLHVLRVGPANLAVTSASGTSTSSGQAAQTSNASSITVVVTPCQSELIKWFANNMQISYELESYKDYAPAVTGPDPACNGINKATGVQAPDIASKFPPFAKALSGN